MAEPKLHGRSLGVDRPRLPQAVWASLIISQVWMAAGGVIEALRQHGKVT